MDFVELCKAGNLTGALELFKKGPKQYFDRAFIYSYTRGHLEVDKWLISIEPDINISADNEYTFQLSCRKWVVITEVGQHGRDHLVVAKWLISIKPDININADNEYAFRWSRKKWFVITKVGQHGRDHLEVVKWLLSIKPDINISAENEYAFEYSYKYGHLGVAKWLVKRNIFINKTKLMVNEQIIEYIHKLLIEKPNLKIYVNYDLLPGQLQQVRFKTTKRATHY